VVAVTPPAYVVDVLLATGTRFVLPDNRNVAVTPAGALVAIQNDDETTDILAPGTWVWATRAAPGADAAVDPGVASDEVNAGLRAEIDHLTDRLREEREA
jgi:hypothetical protein